MISHRSLLAVSDAEDKTHAIVDVPTRELSEKDGDDRSSVHRSGDDRLVAVTERRRGTEEDRIGDVDTDTAAKKPADEDVHHQGVRAPQDVEHALDACPERRAVLCHPHTGDSDERVEAVFESGSVARRDGVHVSVVDRLLHDESEQEDDERRVSDADVVHVAPRCVLNHLQGGAGISTCFARERSSVKLGVRIPEGRVKRRG